MTILSEIHDIGVLADLPDAGMEGRYFYAEDEQILYRDNGLAWVQMPFAGSGAWSPEPGEWYGLRIPGADTTVGTAASTGNTGAPYTSTWEDILASKYLRVSAIEISAAAAATYEIVINGLSVGSAALSSNAFGAWQSIALPTPYVMQPGGTYRVTVNSGSVIRHFFNGAISTAWFTGTASFFGSNNHTPFRLTAAEGSWELIA
jgi:hypothetical protein